MPDKKYLIVVGGPTASGKTALAIRIAQHFKTEILSCDSRQFYKELSIGTAKPTVAELNAIPHHFINSLSIQQSYNVGAFERDALQLLEQLFSANNVVVMTGGSGLYIKAVCEGLDPFPAVPIAIRSKIENELTEKGLSFLQEKLKKLDPVYYDKVDLNNPHRLIRALAVCEASGQPFSSFHDQAKPARNFHPIYLQIAWPRVQLYARINQRVVQMIDQGLEQEARQFYPVRHLQALQSVGYQEFFQYFEGSITQHAAIELIQQNSRRYAKRQLTWSRRDGFWKLFRPDELELALEYISLVTDLTFQLEVTPQDNQLYELRFTHTQNILLALKVYLFKTNALLFDLAPITNLDNLLLAELLVHQGGLFAEERTVFASISAAHTAPFLNQGFTAVSLEEVPQSIQKRSRADHIILKLQKIEA